MDIYWHSLHVPAAVQLPTKHCRLLVTRLQCSLLRKQRHHRAPLQILQCLRLFYALRPRIRLLRISLLHQLPCLLCLPITLVCSHAF